MYRTKHNHHPICNYFNTEGDCKFCDRYFEMYPTMEIPYIHTNKKLILWQRIKESLNEEIFYLFNDGSYEVDIDGRLICSGYAKRYINNTIKYDPPIRLENGNIIEFGSIQFGEV